MLCVVCCARVVLNGALGLLQLTCVFGDLIRYCAINLPRLALSPPRPLHHSGVFMAIPGEGRRYVGLSRGDSLMHTSDLLHGVQMRDNKEGANTMEGTCL